MDSENSNPKSLADSIAASMDCEALALLDYLPYILQDLNELGTSAKHIARIIAENKTKEPLSVIDLGCGKGAVLLEVAQTIDSECLGVDAIEEFVHYANHQAQIRGLKNCVFEAHDIRDQSLYKKQYDIIILGSIGAVFGTPYATMERLKPLLRADGMIILDDGYLEEEKHEEHEKHEELGTQAAPPMLSKQRLFEQIKAASMAVVKEYPVSAHAHAGEQAEAYRAECAHIKNRCQELILKIPSKKALFEAYIRKQEAEYHSLETLFTCSTMLIKRQESDSA